MDAHGAIQRIVAVFVVVVCLSLGALAAPVFTYSGDFALRIPADPDSSKGWMDDAIIEIPDHFPIYDIDVGITLTHTSVFDLQIFLQSPAGTSLCLNMYNFDEFFKGEDYEDTIFDDEADLPIEDGQPPFTGRFRPRAPNLLNVFDGQDVYGPWLLKIYDQWYADTGTLDRVELTITTPEPATAILLLLSTGLMCLHKPRHKQT